MAEDLKLLGLYAEANAYADRQAEDYEIWQENLTTLRVFLALSTQWNVIAGLASVSTRGLKYESVKDVLELMDVARAEWPEVFDGLRVMEAAALKVFHNKDGG